MTTILEKKNSYSYRYFRFKENLRISNELENDLKNNLLCVAYFNLKI